MVKSRKNRIRDLERMMKKPNLDAISKKKAQEKINILKKEIEQQDQSNQEKSMVLKYKRVKFFERRKLLRKVQQISKELKKLQKKKTNNSSKDTNNNKRIKELKEQRDKALDDMFYIIRYPKTQKFLSIMKTPNDKIVADQRSTLYSSIQEQVKEKDKENLLKAILSAKTEDKNLVSDEFKVENKNVQQRAAKGESNNYNNNNNNDEDDDEDFFLPFQ